MKLPFRRLAIVNRGEPARRLLRAARELNEQYRCQLCTIALFTEPDRRSAFVSEADESHALGPSMVLDPSRGTRRSAYLDYALLRSALEQTRAEAVWVGWGFVSEHADFAQLCEEMGLVFVGPPSAVMRRLSDKISSKQLAERASVPVAAWSGGPIDGLDHLRSVANRIGYPMMIKASAGGGGRGIRRVNCEADLEVSYVRAQAEAAAAFGDDAVFAERVVEGARHVEVQVIADAHGNCWSVGVRDCSVQRRHQKLVEEAPSPALSEQLRQELMDGAQRLASTAGYRNAGTVECLYQPREQQFFFMEMNTRLQVEHPVTEATTGLDLVKLQLLVAGGHPLRGDPPPTTGHAIEVRLNAEDPDNNFAPAPGHIRRFRLPAGPGLRVDTGVREGDDIPPDFDSMVAKLIAYGRDRAEALARLRCGLGDCMLIIDGGTSNRAFLLELLAHEDLVTGNIDISWLDRLMASGSRSRPDADVAILAAAIAVFDAEHVAERTQYISSAARGRPKAREEFGLPVELRYAAQNYNLIVYRIAVHEYHIRVDGRRIVVRVDREDEYRSHLFVFSRRHRLTVQTLGMSYLVEVDGAPHRVHRDEGGIVRAPAPAIVVDVPVREGQAVAAGERLVLLEAMKTELPVLAPAAGRVRELRVARNVQVHAAAPLLVLEPIAGSEESGQDSARVGFVPHWETSGEVPALASHDYGGMRSRRHRRNLEKLRPFMLGFDVTTAEARGLVREIQSLRGASAPNAETAHLEDKLLQIFVDVVALYGDGQPLDDGQVARGTEYPQIYFRSIDSQAEGLSQHFVDRLRRVLAHYDVSDLARTRELEDALLWSYRSFRRARHMIPAMQSILERRRDHFPAEVETDDTFKGLLTRLIEVTQDRFAELHDLARQVLFRNYHQVAFDEARARIYQQLETQLRQLIDEPESWDPKALVRLLVDSPFPLAGFLSRWLESGDIHMQQVVLESLLHRFYRIRQIGQVSPVVLGRHAGVLTDFDFQGRATHVVAAYCGLEALSGVLASAASRVTEIPDESGGLIDVFVALPPGLEYDAKQLELLRSAVAETRLPPRISRICVCLLDSRQRRAVDYLTFSSTSDAGLAEVEQYRGLHPMWAGRLDLWRLRDFNIKRLPAGTDTFLFQAFARNNPQDERLFAFVDVRDVTPLDDPEDTTIRLPHFEHMFHEAMDAIRDFQYRRTQERLYWNRVQFFFWGPLAISLDQLSEIIRRLAPATRHLGLEKVVVRARVVDQPSGELKDRALHFSLSADEVIRMRVGNPSPEPIRELSPYAQKVVRSRVRGLTYPYELIRMLTPDEGGISVPFPRGRFQEYELSESGVLAPIQRPYGENTANVIVGTISNITAKHPQGMKRVILLGDPTREMGSLSEPECLRIIAGIDLAQKMFVPIEWYPVSAGAKISMQSGTENLDWTARVLRRIVEFTQSGGEVNVVVCGVNIGAQAYWNAEATMLMHCRGILIMVPQSAMLLTGKRALDYSGGVSAEDHYGIGGLDRIMGPNGQAQYAARDLTEACRLLFQYYDLTYVAPGERFPRAAQTLDPFDRDITRYAHSLPGGQSSSFETIGQIFSATDNPQRKKPFDMRSVMRAVSDLDQPFLERWAIMRDAESAIVWDVHLGGRPVCLLGIESRPLPRYGFIAADGPERWTGGTLFPLSSKKIARGINAASGNRPVVVVANLSGFDGSPESLRNLQLEFGAEIGRAVVNFDGPMIFCVISRYHGGAYVVFSRYLNDSLEVAAIEGSYASVIGGAPAAAVVLSREVERRVQADSRVELLRQRVGRASTRELPSLKAELNSLQETLRTEKQAELAEEFDRVHSVGRAVRVGSVDRAVEGTSLRPYLIDAVRRGMQRYAQTKAAAS